MNVNWIQSCSMFFPHHLMGSWIISGVLEGVLWLASPSLCRVISRWWVLRIRVAIRHLFWKSCVKSKSGQAYKSLIVGGNFTCHVSGLLHLSAVRRKAQSRRTARKMEETVDEAIRKTVKVSSVTDQLNTEGDGSQSTLEPKKDPSWKSVTLLTVLFGSSDFSCGTGEKVIIPHWWLLWKISSH